MIIIFFILNIIILLGISLATTMFDNYLKRISRSIDIFLDPKAYKPKSQMVFISSLVDKYKEYENEESMQKGIQALIKESFYKQKIGVFNLSTIDTITHKGKQLLWANTLIMVIVEGITVGLGEVMSHSVLIILSSILGLILIFFQLYKNIDLKKERLFIKIQNYLYHTYPNLEEKQKEEQKVSLLLNKISVLENQIKEIELASQQVLKEKGLDLEKGLELKESTDLIEDDSGLIEGDIIQLIEYFLLPN